MCTNTFSALAFVNKLIKEDNVAASKDGEDTQNTAKLDDTVIGHISMDDEVSKGYW